MYFQVFIIVCACSFMYRLTLYEQRTEWVWSLLSLVFSFVYLQFFSNLMGLCFLSFIAPFLGITILNVQALNDDTAK